MRFSRALSTASPLVVVALGLMCSLPARGQDITSNLAAHWKLNETSGTSAADSSGNGRTGTVFGSASWQSGLIDNATYLNGSTYVRATGLMGNPSNITVAAWVNLSAADTSGAEVISLGDHVILRLDQDGITTHAVIYNGSTWVGATTSQTYAGTGWHHVAAVFSDSSNYLKLYIDGVEAASLTTFSSISYPGLGSNTYVGRHGNGQTNLDFTGKIDDARVYSRALSATDIAALYLDGWATKKLLLVTDGSSLTSQEVLRRDQFMKWGYEVTTIVDSSAQASYDAAFAVVDVVYVPEEANATSVGSKLRLATIGVVSDESQLDDDLGFATLAGTETAGTTISITDNSHSITSSFGIGSLTILASSQPRIVLAGAEASGLQVLATAASGSTALAVVNTGGALANTISSNSTAAGRRARLPIGGASFSWSALNSNGLTIVQEALAWAAKPSQLVGHWKLDETSGTTATDASVNGNDGTYTNGVTLNSGGPYPGLGAVAVSFDGVNDYVSIPNESDYDITDEITVAAWIKVNQFDANWQAIITKGDWGWRLSRNETYDTLHFACNGLTTESLNGAANVNDGRWHHVVARYDGSTLALYVDGQLDASVGATGNIVSNDQPVYIGANAEQPGRNWDGWLYDVRVYSYALTDEEIAELHGLVGWWKLDETSGTNAADSSLLGSNGTYTNGVTLNTSGPLSGLVAAQFDGLNDHVDLPTYSTDFSDGYSIAVWARPTDSGYWARFLELGNGQDADNFFLTRNATSSTLDSSIHQGSLGPLQRIDATNTIVNDAWHHYAVTCDSTGAAQLYFDGASVANGTIGVPGDVSRSANYVARSSWAIDDYYQGRMWDVRLYNRPLSVEEIQLLYKGGNFEGVKIIQWVEIQ